MKRITILERDILERAKLGYFNSKKEFEILVDKTNKKINDKLVELNKNKRSNFF